MSKNTGYNTKITCDNNIMSFHEEECNQLKRLITFDNTARILRMDHNTIIFSYANGYELDIMEYKEGRYIDIMVESTHVYNNDYNAGLIMIALDNVPLYNIILAFYNKLIEYQNDNRGLAGSRAYDVKLLNYIETNGWEFTGHDDHFFARCNNIMSNNTI